MFHKTTSPRHWLPVILAGLTVCLALIFYATQRSLDLSSVFSGSAESRTMNAQIAPAVTEAEYKAAVAHIAATYAEDGNATRAYDAFIQLHLPASMQQFHIDLIIAFGKLAADQVDDGQARLDALRAQNSWLEM